MPALSFGYSNLTRIITGTVLSQSFDCIANSEIDLTFSKEFPSVPKEIFASITSKNDGLTSYGICSVSVISRSQYSIRLKSNYNIEKGMSLDVITLPFCSLFVIGSHYIFCI